MSHDEDHVRHYRLTHTTTYTYPKAVTSSYGRAVLLPSPGGGQKVHTAGLAITPPPAHTGQHRDFAGNHSAYFHVTEPHHQLQVSAMSMVTVTRRRQDPARLPEVPWERVAQTVRSVSTSAPNPAIGGANTVLMIAESRLPSPMVDVTEEVRAYAVQSFVPGRSLTEVIVDLAGRIYRDFTFSSDATSVNTRLPEILERRVGVCQHFTHLLIGCARSMGLAARYVSGYIETRPPPGAPKLRGVDASHAWAAVWLPGGGWLHIDPTNDQFIDSRYITLGWGRDYQDVSPLRGIVFTEGSGSTLDVSVDLWPIDGGEVEANVSAVRDLLPEGGLGEFAVTTSERAGRTEHTNDTDGGDDSAVPVPAGPQI